MCGIAGYYSRDNSGNKEFLIDRMLNSIQHRGPDDRSTTVIDNVVLGHVRLSIIDIEHGKQPVVSENGRYTLIFNGEIYNYLELRQQLVQKGHHFKTFSDVEVILNMFIEYGKGMLPLLNGMFVIVIYDKAEKLIFLARDPFGIKPLYYFLNDSAFIFASEIKALLQIPVIKAEVDTQSLYEYLTFQFVLKKHTLFKNIAKLEPATFIYFKEGEIIEKREYWQLKYDIDDSKSENQFADELLVLLQDASAIQMRSDVPVGIYLSGGIDSSTIAILASKHNNSRLPNFTGAFHESKEYDETEYAGIVNKLIKGENHLIYPTHIDFIEHFEKLVYHMDEPAAGPGLFSQYMVSRLAAKHVKVVLGGQGGDEIFGGYARYAIAYLEQCLKGAIFETQEEGKYVVTLKSIIENLPLLKQYIPLLKQQLSGGLFDPMDQRYFRLIDRSPNSSKIFQTDFLAEKNGDQIFDKFSQIFNDPSTKSYFNKMTYFDMKTLLPALLHVEDRMSMAVSIESRVPLLDTRIAELVAKMPPSMKFAGGKTKYMLNHAVKNIVPREIIERKDKMGFPTPLNEWLAGPLKEYALDILMSKRAKERGILNTSAIEKQINEEGKFTRDLWGALNLEVWHRTFIDNDSIYKN